MAGLPADLPEMKGASGTKASVEPEASAQPLSESQHGHSTSPKSTATMKMRKRIKTGCLTCRKRRIKCGEERPSCANCIKSKRQCEGYNQRVVFKAPMGDWPNHPSMVSTIQYHTAMLPGTRHPMNQSPPYQSTQAFAEPHEHTNAPLLSRPLDSFDTSSMESLHLGRRHQPATLFKTADHEDDTSFGLKQFSSTSPVLQPQASDRDSLDTSLEQQKHGERTDPGPYHIIPPYVVISQSGGALDPAHELDEERLRRDKTMLLNRLMTHFNTVLRTKSLSESSSESDARSNKEDWSNEEDFEMWSSVSDFSTMTADNSSLSPSDQGTSSQGSKQSSSSTMVNEGVAQCQSTKQKGKRRKQWNDEDEIHSDNDEVSRKRSKLKPSFDENSDLRRFACPYFQRNPEQHRGRRSCISPGWKTVHRVKEHCFRHHRQRVHCPRCYYEFESEALLFEHQRANVPCQRSITPPPEGLNKSQEKALRSRKQRTPDATEEQKWKEVYRILFPCDDEDMMPSPYVDSNWERCFQQGGSNNELAQYEAFLRERLPDAVRMELETLIEREFPFQERIISSMIGIVRNQQQRLFQMYTHSQSARQGPLDQQPPLTEGALGERSAQPISQTDHGFTLDAYWPAADSHLLLDAVEPYNAPPYPSEPFTDSFEAILFDMQDCSDLAQSFNDSAYGSVSWNKDGNTDGSRNKNAFSGNTFFEKGEGPSGTSM